MHTAGAVDLAQRVDVVCFDKGCVLQRSGWTVVCEAGSTVFLQWAWVMQFNALSGLPAAYCSDLQHMLPPCF
jgi:hypothetical protein